MAAPSLLPAVNADRNIDYLSAAEAAVRAYCGWHISPVIAESVVLDGTGARTLFVKTLRLVSITAATVDGTVVDPLTLEWSEAGFVRAAGVWPDKFRSVSLSITHGFDTVPDVVEIVRAIAARAASAPTGVVREQAGAVSVSLSQVAPGVSGGVVLMDHERRMLDRYRISGGR